MAIYSGKSPQNLAPLSFLAFRGDSWEGPSHRPSTSTPPQLFICMPFAHPPISPFLPFASLPIDFFFPTDPSPKAPLLHQEFFPFNDHPTVLSLATGWRSPLYGHNQTCGIFCSKAKGFGRRHISLPILDDVLFSFHSRISPTM